MSELDTSIELFGEKLSMPTILAPVGACGMYARRGEVQAAQAADNKGVPFTLSTVSICPIEEVAPAIKRPMWFQLYVLKDRGFMKNALARAKAAGCSTLVFTVDMPTPKKFAVCYKALLTLSGRMMWVSKANRTLWAMFQLIWVDKLV